MRHLSGIGGASVAPGIEVMDNAVIDSRFRASQPGRYEVTVMVRNVPVASSKEPFFNVENWTAAMARAGYDRVRVTKVNFVVSMDTEVRSTGGWFDVWDLGVAVTDVRYRLTVEVLPEGQTSGVSGVGAITAAGWWAIAGVAIALNLLVYAISGTDVIVETVKWAGNVAGAAATGVATAAVPVLVIGALALLVFVKLGGKGSIKGFSVGG